MPADRTEPPVTAFMLVKTTPEWLAMTVAERVQAFATQVVPVIEARTRGVRSRFYDTEFSSARVTRLRPHLRCGAAGHPLHLTPAPHQFRTSWAHAVSPATSPCLS
ncbi:darcynin family protein [Nonomuraea roseoviolacea]|uniref:Uncharacterized protein n=1 Tax=Nonomuraea roseoviolacea subsp. carminata TaxID=160689 RepID=A0ABT1KC92_9ACTN|nr:darcynin family protein [Nonomuraea roseoviolacea]MCP2351631.1 hypothetical protein [Nonomuraea roseoviolacea subsp. carminata]